MKELWDLFIAFFRVGLFTFGGGYSMLPMLEREVVEKRGWVCKEELLDYFAIGQCTPGIIAVNTATLVGSKQRGGLGAVAATLGVITPSVIIILIIASVLREYMHIAAVARAFAGIRVAVCALIAAAVIRLVKSNVLTKKQEGGRGGFVAFFRRDGIAVCTCVAAFALVAFLKVSPVVITVGAAILGLILYGKGRAD